MSAARVFPVMVGWKRQVLMPRPHRPDWQLLVAVAMLVGLGVVMVFNASYFYAQANYQDPFLFFRRHCFYLAVGLGAGGIVSRVRIELFERYAYWILFVCVLMLIAVMIPGIGVVRGGARRWINLGVLSFQPAEFVKIAIVLYLARSITRKSARMSRFAAGLLPHLVVVGAIVLMIVRQPDFGTAAILVLVMLMMLHIGGARSLHLGLLVAAASPVVVYEIAKAPYRLQRVLCFVDPWSYSRECGFQLVQSLIAFGSGGVLGVGLGESKQKLFFLPEAHTDFIFALVGEELGLLGAALVLGLFVLFAVRGFRIAVRHPDPFASHLAFGLTVMIVLEAVVNIGVVIGLLPTKGLALPFLSYGGSSLIGTMVQVGILGALSRTTG